VALSLVVAVFGPPAAGKTTLTMALAAEPGRQVFRLREHVPPEILAATATSAERLGWIDDNTVADALRRYIEAVNGDGQTHTVLFDNFPGSAEQVGLLLATLRELVPVVHVEAVELTAAPKVLNKRARNRRVCHRCERDPISDPRMPAEPSSYDPWRCSRCSGLLHPRRGDAPTLLRARMQRYRQTATGIREAFTAAGVAVSQLDSSDNPTHTVQICAPLLIARSELS
jgi:adenylate kinase